VQSFSYEYQAYTSYHAMAPNRPIGGGESASCVSDRGYYGRTNSTTGHVGPSSLFDCVSSSWASVAQSAWVYGNFAWTGFDYMGETYPLGWPDVSSHFGIHDLAGFEKDGVGYYRAWWRDAPAGCGQGSGGNGSAVSLAISPGHWTDPVPSGQGIDVTVTTCAASVDLFVNGQRQQGVGGGGGGGSGGSPTPMPAYGFVTWPQVVYVPGNITAVAYDAGGKVLAVTTHVTAGPPAALVVWVEDIYQPGRNASVISADGQDAAVLGVALVDSAGVLVPNADVNVTFTVSGPAQVVGVANGDPADHSPVDAEWRLTFHGLARAIVASSAPGAAGPIVVTASAAGLQTGTVALEAVQVGGPA
jgi:beta-galactosidase